MHGNITDSKKFVTDGHSMFLLDATPKGMIFKKDEIGFRRTVSEASIQNCWDVAEKREQVQAQFIGCGKKNTDTFVAVVRDERGRIAAFNPWILKFVLMVTQADALAFSPSPNYNAEMAVALCKGKIVGAVMPMRIFVCDLAAYDLTGPAVSIKDEEDAANG